VLVRYRVPINEKNSRGNTALHLAAAHHHPKIVELLLSVGANPFTENDDRCKPVELVPESDSVTRQMLKSAMANPRPAPLDASMLSLRQDLHNLSMMPGVNVTQMLSHRGPKPAGTLGHESSIIPNGIPPRFAAQQVPGANRSFRTMSSSSSVFMDDTKARLGALQLPQQPKQDQETNNAIPLYTPVNKPLNTSSRHAHGTASHQTSLDRSIVPLSPARGETKRRSGRDKASSASPNNRDPERSHRSGRHGKASVDSQNNHDTETSQMVEKKNRTNRQRDSAAAAAAMPPVADRSSRRHNPNYENVSFDNTRDRSSSSRKHRSKKDKRPKHRSSKSADYSVGDEDEEVEDMPSGYYDDDAGVKVHTVPGKPSTIEVEYTGGPIIVSVDTQGDSLESLPPQQTSDSSSSSSSSSSSDEDRKARHNRSVDALDRKKKKKKKKKKKRKHREKEVQSADELMERRSKRKHARSVEEPIYENYPRKMKDRGKEVRSSDETLEKHGKGARRHRSEEEPVYANQSQILAERRRQEEERAALEEQERMEQERLERDAERERIDEAEANRIRHEERERRKAKKMQRRQQRQNIEEPEPPVFLEAKPSLTYPREMWAEPEYDSDDIEHEQQLVADNAKRKAFAAAHSLIQRWSEAEDDHEDYPPTSRYRSGGVSEKTKKPPRPSVSPQRLDADGDFLPGSVATEDDVGMPSANPVPKPRTTILQSKSTEPDKRYETFLQEMDRSRKKEADERFETVPGAERKSDSDGKYETVMHEKKNLMKIELTTVAVLNRSSDQPSSDDAKWVDAKLMEQSEQYAEEVVIPDEHSSAVLDPGVAITAPSDHRGLRMRVTGEMPKAYTRGEKDSARKAFMLAPPVSIETGSEESDSELSSPQHSAPEPTALWDHGDQHRVESNDEMEPLPPTTGTDNSGSKPTKLPLYAKPYRSFGKIEPKVDALEQALKEELKKKVKEKYPEQQGKL